ncbi:MAG: putative Na+/H+ antiporter [Puniceicoccales bacterium]|jgi:hypothetical protein|nr:putative Na+/H+ antiporter [Puniceicoccales bacterium]
MAAVCRIMRYVLATAALLLQFANPLAAASCASSEEFPLPLSAYETMAGAHAYSSWGSIAETVLFRLRAVPLNGLVTLFFIAAIGHIFLGGMLTARSHRLREMYVCTDPGRTLRRRLLDFRARLWHILGEIELPFAMWAVPSLASIAIFYGPSSLAKYVEKISFAEPIFIVAIMAVASTRPILQIAETVLSLIARFFGGTATSWWFAILLAAPPLGSLITEPAAMTIAAILLAKKFYPLGPSERLSYGTLGLLFANISVGGALTHFAAPPILMVAGRWQWTTAYVFMNIGIRAICGIIFATATYGIIFRRELAKLKCAATADVVGRRCPPWVIICHIAFMIWIVCSLHSPTNVIGGFAVFLVFSRCTSRHQSKLRLRESTFVGIFLAGLAIHGGMQGWWMEPLLMGLKPLALFAMAASLSSFNDNAAVTYLTSMVPSFHGNCALQNAVVSGAVCSGGLTVIANAPNPAGQALLKNYFSSGVSPFKLFLSAALPTAIMAFCFLV